uniref:Uncharacterized protein n=2 Tax=Clytia hemisphaerica TaxID=252671 RepID=A0A7M5WUT8_9CNID
MANRRLVRAITENINQGSSVSLVDQNNNGLRSKQFQEASCCSSKQKSCNVITERKTNVIKRLWRRLKGNKPQKKQTVNRETADEVVKSEKVEQKWYHKLSWCGNDKNTDTENKVKEDWELAVTGECDYSKGDAFQVNSSETLIIADNTFIVIGNKILKTPVEKVDAGVEENRLANENEYHRTGIGSIVDFASPKRGFPMVDVDSSGSFKPVSEPRAAKRVTTFCKLQPVPTTTQKQDSRVRPSVDSGIGGSNPSNGLSAEKNRPSPLLIDTTPKRYSKEEINVTLKNSKNVASAIFKQVSRLSLNGASTSVDKDDSYDNGALSVEDEVDEEIERAMNQVRVQPKGKGEFQIEREKRMFNPFMLRQTPNLSEGASGMCWSLSHRMPGEGGFRSATPKPKLPVARKKSMREVLLRHEHAKSVKAKKDQRKLEKITRRNQRVLDVRQSLEDKLQAMASGQEAKTEQTRRRRQDLHTARVGKTDRRLELARQRRKEIAATEKKTKK